MKDPSVCSVCAGTGKPVSGKRCICGGAGTQAAELQGFRLRVHELEMTLRDADILAKNVDEQIQFGNLDARSAIADARLDYGTPLKYEYL